MCATPRLDLDDGGGATAVARRRRRDLDDVGAVMPSASFARLVEGQIIPRLLVAHGDGPPSPQQRSGRDSGGGFADVESFTRLTLHAEAPAMVARVDALMALGMTSESIYIDLLAPTARRLGRMWEDDDCDFVDVTMGLWRLQEVVHALAGRSRPRGRDARNALFAAPPGEQHGFGATLVGEVFRAAGWDAWIVPAPGEGELEQLVAQRSFGMVGLTVACARHIAPLPALIAALRERSLNPGLVVMVGGKVFNEDPGLAKQVGADATAIDGRQAVAKAEMLIDVCTLRSGGSALELV